MKKSGIAFDHSAEINGKNLKFNLNDMLVGDYLFQQVVLKQEYYPDEIDYSGIKNVVDIGANVGLFSLLTSALFPESKIYSFEPAAANIRKFEFHLSINSCDQIKIFPFGLGANNQKRQLFMPHDEGAYSLYESNAALYTRGDGYKGNKELVEIRHASEAIDELNLGIIDYLKIDCEGAELEILSTLDGQLSKVRYMAIEWHPNVSVLEIERVLSKNNFSYFRKFERFKNNDTNLSMGTMFAFKG
jgi:FkbM family methyltransferase